MTLATCGAKASAVCPAPVAMSSAAQSPFGWTSSTRRARLAPLAWTADVA